MASDPQVARPNPASSAASDSTTAQRRRRLLEHLVHATIEGTQSISLVIGSVGMGKTTFARELADMATSAGIRVGWGVSGEFAGSPPLAPWGDAIASVDGSDLHDFRGGQSALAGSESDAGSHSVLYQSVARWLTTASGRQPILIVLEDLHDADSSTVALFRYLGRRPRNGSWMVIGTSRPGLSDISGFRCDTHHLDGIDVEEIVALAASTSHRLDRDEAEALREQTGGNPLFVRRLVELHFDTTGHAPSLASLIRDEFARLPDELRPLAEALAVLGPSSDVDLVAHVADISLDDTVLLSGSTSDEMLVRRGATLAFTHALLRDVVLDGLSMDRRSELHARAADVLARRDDNPVRIAHHLRQAANDDVPEAADFATEAGRLALAAGAYSEAIEHHTAAVRLHERHGDADRLARALVLQARALSYSGQIVAAEDVLTSSVHIGDQLDDDSKTSVLREFTRLRWREEPADSSLNSDRLLGLADSWLGGRDDPTAIAVLHLARVGAAEITGTASASLDDADVALTAARRTGDEQLIGEAHLARRRAMLAPMHSLDSRRNETQAAIAAAVLIDDRELLSRSQRMAIIDAVAALDRPAALSLQSSMAKVPTAGLREHEALWRCGLAMLEGHRTEAERILDEASQELSYLGLETPTLVFVRALFALDDGNFAEAMSEYESLLPMLADPVLDAAFALGAMTAGDLEGARELLDRCIPTVRTDTDTVIWPLAVGIAAEVAAGLDHPQVPELLDLIRPLAGRAVVPAAATIPWLGTYDRLIGLLELRLGNIDAAHVALETSLRQHESMRARPWIARSHAALALTCDLRGELDEAATHRRRAARIAEELAMGDVLVIGDYSTAGPRSTRDTAQTDRADAALGVGTFQRVGTSWQIGLEGRMHTHRHLAGLAQLHLLVEHPGVDWHVLDLYGQTNASATVSEQDSGPVLDEAARSSYQRRYQELAHERDRLDGSSDLAALEQIDDEIDALEDELVKAFGLGGRARRLDDPAERARVNVKRSITRALATIAEMDSSTADHLHHRITTGRFCRYSPDLARPIVWTTAPPDP